MPDTFTIITLLLGLLAFLVYWILGGVVFALVTIWRLGRVKKVRFSCLFSLLALICGAAVSIIGVNLARPRISACFETAESQSEVLAAVFGCGFAGIFGTFLLGAAVLLIGGFVIMHFARSKSRPWIHLDFDGEDTLHQNPEQEGFFDTTDQTYESSDKELE